MPPLLPFCATEHCYITVCVFPKTVARCNSYFLVKDIGVVPFHALFADKHRLSQIFPQTVFFWPCVSFEEGTIIKKEDSAVNGLYI